MIHFSPLCNTVNPFNRSLNKGLRPLASPLFISYPLPYFFLVKDDSMPFGYVTICFLEL